MSNADWWARQLGTPAQRLAPLPPTYPQPLVQPPAQQPSRLPMSARNTSGCPSCGSGNYGSTGETRARCYDCGYPVVQSGSGIGGTGSSSGPTLPARQAHGDGFNPGTIVGKA